MMNKEQQALLSDMAGNLVKGGNTDIAELLETGQNRYRIYKQLIEALKKSRYPGAIGAGGTALYQGAKRGVKSASKVIDE